MGKHMYYYKTLCPCYRHEDAQMIYCDGPEEGSVMHLAFADRGIALSYKKERCRKNYMDCPLYQMLNIAN